MKSIHQNESHDYQLSSHVNKKYTDTGKTTKNKKQWKKTLKDIKKKKCRCTGKGKVEWNKRKGTVAVVNMIKLGDKGVWITKVQLLPVLFL